MIKEALTEALRHVFARMLIAIIGPHVPLPFSYFNGNEWKQLTWPKEWMEGN